MFKISNLVGWELSFALRVLIAITCGYIAVKKNRNVLYPFILCLIVGPSFGLVITVIYLVLPKKVR